MLCAFLDDFIKERSKNMRRLRRRRLYRRLRSFRTGARRLFRRRTSRRW